MNRAVSIVLALVVGALVAGALVVGIGAVFFVIDQEAAAAAGSDDSVVPGDGPEVARGTTREPVPEIAPPMDVEPERVPMARSGPAERPPPKPDLSGLSGAERIAAVRAYRAYRDAWRRDYGRPGLTPERRAVRWAAHLLAEPRLLAAPLTAGQVKVLVDLHAGLRFEALTIGRSIDAAAEPIFRERIAKGDYEERALARGYPHPSPGIVHRHGVYPARNDPRRQVRRIVSILPLQSPRIDSLRSDRQHLRRVVRAELVGHVRSWKELQFSERRK